MENEFFEMAEFDLLKLLLLTVSIKSILRFTQFPLTVFSLSLS